MKIRKIEAALPVVVLAQVSLFSKLNSNFIILAAYALPLFVSFLVQQACAGCDAEAVALVCVCE